jgi:hypothetical protein
MAPEYNGKKIVFKIQQYVRNMPEATKIISELDKDKKKTPHQLLSSFGV